MGKFSYIGSNCNLSRVKIGRFCSIACNVKLVAGRHPTNFISSSPYFYSKSYLSDGFYDESNKFEEFHFTDKQKKYFLEIGNDVWIGDGVTFLDGVKIGNGAIIGTNALVTKDVEPYAIVGGVPAKVIRYRFSPDIIDKLLKLKWWDKDDEWIINNKQYFDNVENSLNKLEKN